MKKAVVFTISFYQKFLNILLKMMLGTNHFCRHNPTCSDYAKNAIIQYGLVKGGLLSTARILSCQPITMDKTRMKIKNYLNKKFEDR
jgi:putative membrane protein insertion efficiency factor